MNIGIDHRSGIRVSNIGPLFGISAYHICNIGIAWVTWGCIDIGIRHKYRYRAIFQPCYFSHLSILLWLWRWVIAI